MGALARSACRLILMCWWPDHRRLMTAVVEGVTIDAVPAEVPVPLTGGVPSVFQQPDVSYVCRLGRRPDRRTDAADCVRDVHRRRADRNVASQPGAPILRRHPLESRFRRV